MKTFAKRTSKNSQSIHQENTSTFFNSSGINAFFKPLPIFVQRQQTSPSSAAPAPNRTVWEVKLDGYKDETSTKDQRMAFYKDLLEGEILEKFQKNEMVDVLVNEDDVCDPDHLTLILKAGDGKKGDYVPPDNSYEEYAKEGRNFTPKDHSEVSAVLPPDLWCRRVFLNDILRDNPQKFHATYVHENAHHNHRQQYKKRFEEWQKIFSNRKKTD